MIYLVVSSVAGRKCADKNKSLTWHSFLYLPIYLVIVYGLISGGMADFGLLARQHRGLHYWHRAPYIGTKITHKIQTLSNRE